MVLPISYETKIRSVEKRIREAKKQFDEGEDATSLASEVTDALISLHLLLDRAQFEVWRKLNSKNTGKRKPNIYFPCCTTRERFEARMSKDQMPDLEEKNSEVFRVIEGVQPYKCSRRWWQKLYDITSNRHERDANVSKGSVTTGFGLGKGQNLYIREMKISGSNVYFDGDATNQKTGKKEPLRVDPTTEDVFLLEDLKVQPVVFANLCTQKTKQTLTLLFNALDKNQG